MLYLHGFILRFIFSFVVSTFRQVTYYVSSTCWKRFKYNFVNSRSLCIFGNYISLIKGSDEKLFLIISKYSLLLLFIHRKISSWMKLPSVDELSYANIEIVSNQFYLAFNNHYHHNFITILFAYYIEKSKYIN